MRWLVSFMIILLIWACDESEETENQFVYTGPAMTTENLAISYSDSGRVIVKMSTAIQEKLQNEDEVYPKAVYVNFINDDAVEYSSLRGDSGKYIKMEDHYIIMGNVFFYNREQQQSLSTNELIWSPAKKIVYSNKKVQINTPTDQLVGNGMEAAQDFSTYKFIGGITGFFKVDSLITKPDTTNTKLLK
jgi:LPS export ABC transporter protein LptC